MYKVSVVVAVYKAERYIERCARSLFSQSMDDIEFIFVDDGSPDDSIKILQRIIDEYPARCHSVKIIRHSINMGVAAARTTGMKEATGEYVTHCDPDDWLEKDACEIAYENAKASNADILTFGYRILERDRVINVRKAFSGSGLELLDKWQFATMLCCSLISNNLIKKYDLYPFQGINSGEDTNTVVRAYYYAAKVYGIEDVLYNYDRTNETSITSISYVDNLYKNLIKNVEALEEWFKTNTDNSDFISKLKCTIKADILFRKDVADSQLAFNLWPEVNRYWSRMDWYSHRTKMIIRLGMIYPSLVKYILYFIKKR